MESTKLGVVFAAPCFFDIDSLDSWDTIQRLGLHQQGFAAHNPAENYRDTNLDR